MSLSAEPSTPSATGSVYCRECGGPNRGGVRQCEFCYSAIATVRCAHCYVLNVPDHDHCAACGEALGLQPIAAPSLVECPQCCVALTQFQSEDGLLLDCAKCGSQFVEHRLLDALIARRQRFRRSASTKPKPQPLDAEVQYRRCPLCEHLMNRRNFARQSGIIVDVCVQHGVWFDPWELQHVLAYVEAGGVAEARRQTLGLPAPQTAEEQKRAACAVAAALRRGPSERGSPWSGNETLWEVFESGVEALSEIGRWLGKRG